MGKITIFINTIILETRILLNIPIAIVKLFSPEMFGNLACQVLFIKNAKSPSLPIRGLKKNLDMEIGDQPTLDADLFNKWLLGKKAVAPDGFC